MATGAGDQYWEQQMLPSVFKHDLLRRYLPILPERRGLAPEAWFISMGTPEEADTTTGSQRLPN